VRNLFPLVDRPGIDPAAVDAAERLLTEQASQFGPKDLKVLADRVVDHLDRDGNRPDAERNASRRFFHLCSTTDGVYTGEFRLTGPLGSKLHALLGPLAKPRIATLPGPDGER